MCTRVRVEVTRVSRAADLAQPMHHSRGMTHTDITAIDIQSGNAIIVDSATVRAYVGIDEIVSTIIDDSEIDSAIDAIIA